MVPPMFKAEEIIDADRPIIDAHHHLWNIPVAALPHVLPSGLIQPEVTRYLFDDILDDVSSGHNVKATVFAECGAMYRSDGPEEYRSVGEVEFANGVAAMAESGAFGNAKVCAGIVGLADLSMGDRVEEVLVRHIAAGGGRYRGVRVQACYDADVLIVGNAPSRPAGLLGNEGFRLGAAVLERLALSLDILVLEPQLPEVVDLGRKFPGLRMILNHVGIPLGIASYEGRLSERFPIWREHMRQLATCENVAVKVGGMGMPFAGFPSFGSTSPASSFQLAQEWRPYVETCIEVFGAERCMFESNYPVDAGTASYATIWNTFKLLTEGASEDEKSSLFYQTANDIYRLGLPRPR